MSQRNKALAALIGAMVLVGGSVAVGRELVAGLPLYFASLVRFVLASVVLVPLVLVVEGGWPRVSPRGLAILGAQALCGSFLFTVCLLAGLTLTGAASAGVVSATTPAAVALMGRFVFREPLSGRAMAGLAATVAGLAALQAGGGAPTGPAPLWGNALVLAAVFFEAIFLLLRRVLPDPLSPLAAAMWVSLLGGILFLVPGVWQAFTLDPKALTPAMLAALAYYGLAVTAGAYILWFYGVVRVDAALAGVVTGVMPVAALACAAGICGESLGWRELVGCAGVLGGIVCLAGRGTPKKAPASATAGDAGADSQVQEPEALGGGGT
ncbi:MAG: DMT family transporter [Desulfovibrionaceae bacterium]